MKRIRQLVLNRTGDALPMLRIGQPIRTVRHECPGPHMSDPVRQRIDVAIGSISLRDLAGEPVDRYFTLPHQESIEGHDQLGVHRGSDLAVNGNLADVPQQAHRAWAANLACVRQRLEGFLVHRAARPRRE
mgnify:CR=1 FL=1